MASRGAYSCHDRRREWIRGDEKAALSWRRRADEVGYSGVRDWSEITDGTLTDGVTLTNDVRFPWIGRIGEIRQ